MEEKKKERMRVLESSKKKNRERERMRALKSSKKKKKKKERALEKNERE